MFRAKLAVSLAQHRGAQRTQSAVAARLASVLADVREPFSRRSESPGHLTASAFVLSPDRERVALIWHTALERWLQPGGHIEVGDRDVFDAARREVTEETGLAELDRLAGYPELLHVDIHEIPARPSRGEGMHTHFDTRAAFVSRTTDLVVGDGVSAARWVPLDEVRALPTDASVMGAVDALRGVRHAPIVSAQPARGDDALPAEAAKVLAHWFGADPAAPAETVRQRWFAANPALDAEIEATFGSLVEAALRGECDHWAATARGRLALILLLDQFTRQIGRGQPSMIAGDASALHHTTDAVLAGDDRVLAPYEAMFLLMPLMHSESKVWQAVSVAAFRDLAERAQAVGLAGLDGTLEFAIRHREIIDRWGRFPHRNKIFGRTSTEAEIAFLQTPGSAF